MHRKVAVLAVLLGIASEAVAVAASPPGSSRWSEAAVGAVIVAYAAVGLLILWHRPGHPVGRLTVTMVPLWGVGEALVALTATALLADPTNRLAALGSVLGSTLRAVPWLVLVLWLPLVFPDGVRRDTRLRRTSYRVAATTIVAFVAVTLLSPALTDIRFPHVDNPIGLPAATQGPMDGLAALDLLLGLVSVGLAVACLVQQYRHGGPLSRQQTLIFGLAFVPPVAALLASFGEGAGPWLFGLSTLPLPVAIGVALLQRRLYDLPLVVNRSLTYGGLWLLIAILYAITVGGVGVLAGEQGARWLPWVATGIVAVTFEPLRAALQRAANRVTYGQWAEPAAVLARTSRRLDDAGDLGALLDSLTRDLADDLGLGCVQVLDSTGTPVASSGTPDGPTDELPLSAYGVAVGTLRWTRRRLRPADRELLVELAARLGAAVQAQGLLASVRAAQERLVLAREEERRRLRRDLHDGLGPALAGLTLQVDTVRNLVARDPDGADDALLGLRAGIQDTVLDVRRIVEGLRPPALDDLGLVDALRQLAVRTGVPVEVEAPNLPRMPAAVEVAAYRIAQEALANAARHAGATHARVRLRSEGTALALTVDDDGCGQVRPRPDGIGLGSMRERAEEIGGEFALDAVPGRGTRVRALLPLTGGPSRG